VWDTSPQSSEEKFKGTYLDEEQDENRTPRKGSDVFEIGLTTDEESKARMEERRAKLFRRMTASRKPQQRASQQLTTIKPLRTRNTFQK